MVNQTPTSGRTPRFRVVIAAAVATLLLGSSFYAAQAGGGNNGGYSDSLDGLEIAAIGVGAVGGGFAIASMLGGDNDDDEEDASAAKAKKTVSELRVRPSQKQLTSGDATSVEVEARYQGSNAWTNVTDRASVRLVDGALTQVDGAKNAFAVPYGSKVVAGNAQIKAEFGGQSASATVAVN